MHISVFKLVQMKSVQLDGLDYNNYALIFV